MIKISTSKENVSMVARVKISFAAALVKHLKPHWVSLKGNENNALMSLLKPLPIASLAQLWRRAMIELGCRRDAITTAKPRVNSASAKSISSTGVERSASVKRTASPFAIVIPSRTANPLPRFTGNERRTMRLFVTAILRTFSAVESVEPSSMTISSYCGKFRSRWAASFASVSSMRASSLYAGTTTDIEFNFKFAPGLIDAPHRHAPEAERRRFRHPFVFLQSAMPASRRERFLSGEITARSLI